MGQKLVYIFQIIFFIAIDASAQSGLIKGIVTDSAGNRIPDVNVVLYKDKDSTISSYTFTDQNGCYLLKYNNCLPVLISASSMGFAKTYKDVRIHPGVQDHLEINFLLKAAKIDLNVVNIIDKPKIRQHGDTTTYTLSSFSGPTDRSLENALTKLPGFKVNENGTISVNGTPIQKILIDGDDLLDKNYKLLSKNLSAVLVDKVQVLDKFVDNPLMAGLEKTSDKALNITLKDEGKRLFFGDLSLEGGLKNRYASLANGILLTKKTKAYVVSNNNNAGNEAASADIEAPPKATLLSKAFDPEINSVQLANISAGRIPVLDYTRSLFNKAFLQSISVINKSIPKLSVRSNINFYSDRNTQRKYGQTLYNLLSDTISVIENQAYLKKTVTLDGSAQLIYDFTAASRLTYNLKFGTGSIREVSVIDNNNHQISQHLENRINDLDQRLNYTWRMNDHEAFIAEVAFINKKTPQNLYVNGYDYSAVFNFDTSNLFQFYSNPVAYSGVQVKYYARHKTTTLAYTLGYDYQSEQIVSQINSAGSTSTQLNVSSAFQNRMNYHKKNIYLDASINKSLTSALEVTTKLSLSALSGQLQNLQLQDMPVTERSVYVGPDIALSYTLNKKSKLVLSYAYKQDYPQASTLYDGYIAADYRQFNRYNAVQSLLKQYHTSLRYNYSDIYSQFIGFANAFYTIHKNSYSDSLTIDENFVLDTRYPVTSGNKLIGLLGGLDKYIPFLSATIKLQSYVLNSRYQNALNNQPERKINNWTTDTKLSLVSAFSSPLNFSSSVQYRTATNVIRFGEDKYTTGNSLWKGFLQCDVKLKKNIFIQLSGTGYYWGSSSSQTKPCYFFDGGFLYDVINNKLSFSATIKNALNNTAVNFVNLTDFQYNINSYQVLPRIMLFGVKYHF